MRVLIDGHTYFEGWGYYGGKYHILGRIKEEHMELLMQLMDTYIELNELLYNAKQKEMEKKKMDNETLLTLYNIVFDENGNVKPCGRQNCINLITFINGVTHTDGIYGNKRTGQMEVDAIKQFVKSKELI